MSEWDAELIEQLRQAARSESFEFQRVATRLRAFIHSRGTSRGGTSSDSSFLTEAACRKKFAEDFNATQQQEGEVEAEEEQTEGPLLDPSEGNTFEEVLMRLDAQEERHLKRKEEIFSRVLTSLGGSDLPFDMTDDIQVAFHEAREKRLAEKAKLEQRAKELAERKALELQRMQLRSRFDDGSEDAAGDAWQPGRTSGDEENEDDGYDKKFVDAFDIDNVLESAEFDAMLTAIEEDLHSQAAGKYDDGGGDSELGEILKFLDESAKSKKPSKSSAAPTAKFEGLVHTMTATQAAPPPPPPPPPTYQESYAPLKVSVAERPVFERRSTAPQDDESEDSASDDDDDDGDWRKRRQHIKAAGANAVTGGDQGETRPPNFHVWGAPKLEDEEEEEGEEEEEEEAVEERVTTIPIQIDEEDGNQDRDEEKNLDSAEGQESLDRGEEEEEEEEEVLAPPSVATSNPLASGSILSGGLGERRRERQGIMQQAKTATKRTHRLPSPPPPPIPSSSPPLSTESVEGVRDVQPPPTPPVETDAPTKSFCVENPFSLSSPPTLDRNDPLLFALTGSLDSEHLEAVLIEIAEASSTFELYSLSTLGHSVTIGLRGEKSAVSAFPVLSTLEHYGSSSALSRTPSSQLCHSSQSDETSEDDFFSFATFSSFWRKAPAVRSFFTEIKGRGLCLVGARTAYIPPAEDIDDACRKILPSDLLKSAGKSGVFTLVLALHGMSNALLSLSPTDTFREVLGPDDPALAKRTDPLSLRALYGDSRQENIGCTPPRTAGIVKREMSFWFGGKGVTQTTMKPTFLWHRILVVSDDSTSSTSARHKRVLTACRGVLTRGLAVMSEVELVTSQHLAMLLGPNKAEGLALVVDFCTTISGSVLFNAFQASAAKAGVLSPNMRLEFKPNVQSREIGFRADLSSVMPTMHQSCFGSHKDVGLHDVFVVVITPGESSSRKVQAQEREWIVYEILNALPADVENAIVALGQASTSADYSFALCGFNFWEDSDKISALVSDRIASLHQSYRVTLASDWRVLRGVGAAQYLQREFVSRGRLNFSPAERLTRAMCPIPVRGIQSLFPPTDYIVSGVVFVPVSNATRVLSRCCKRLERELDIVAIEACRLEPSTLIALAQDAVEAYDLVQQGAAATVLEWAKSLAPEDHYYAIFVRGPSALHRLKTIVGPPLVSFADEAYPRSLVSSLNTPGGPTTNSPPVVFASLTVSSTEFILKLVFGVESVAHSLTLKALFRREGETSEDDPGARGLSFEERQKSSTLQVCSAPRNSSVTVALPNELGGILITPALIDEVGLSACLEVLIREGFTISNVFTASLREGGAGKLLASVGQSSLSMKPPLALMLAGPCVFLAIEGPGGSMNRLKSFTSSSGGSKESVWKLSASGEWGALSSSSTRLSKELLEVMFL